MIVCTDVLEHVPEPIATVAEISRILQPGGWAFLQLPFGGYIWRSEMPKHINDFANSSEGSWGTWNIWHLGNPWDPYGAHETQGSHELMSPWDTCDTCANRFSRKSHLESHFNSFHSGNRPFKCKICEYSSSSKQNLKSHTIVNHRGIKPLKSFECGLCENKSFRWDLLKI